MYAPYNSIEHFDSTNLFTQTLPGRSPLPTHPAPKYSTLLVPQQQTSYQPPVMNDQLAKRIEAEWKRAFPDASIFPVIGFPSKGNGVMTLTHSMGNQMPKLKINGLTSLSPLANNALFSTEVSGGKWLTLYEIMIPDIPGVNGSKSSGAVYEDALVRSGITIDGDHYHWKASQPFMLAIHTSAIGMHPIEFVRKTIAALNQFISQFPHHTL